MQGNKFKYYIKNQAGDYYYVDNLDTVQVSLTPVELVHTPKGWMEMITGLYHNTKRKGNFKKVTTPLNFVLDGKKIIDYIAAYEGCQGFADFVIEQQVPDDFSYTLFFNGTIDFEEYVFGEVTSTANIREQTLLDIIEAKESVVYEVLLDSSNSVDVQEDGINLHYKTLDTVLDGFGTTPGWNCGFHIIELIEASSENPYTKATKRTVFPSGVSATRLINTGQDFYNTPVNSTIKIDFDFSYLLRWTDSGTVPGPATALTTQIARVDISNNIAEFIWLYHKTGQTQCFGVSYLSGIVHHVVGTLNINVNAGDRLYLMSIPINTNNAALAEFTYQGSPAEFIIDSLQRSPATLHKGIRPYKLWQELVTKASNGAYGAVSPFLFANNNMILIPGSSLRADAIVSIKTTLADFLKYIYVNHLGIITDIIGNNGEIRHISDAFLNVVSMNLGEVANFEWAFSKEHQVGTVKVGYENIDFGVDNQINGKDEFNQTNFFTTGQDKLKAEYDIVSPYIASMYAHELLRVNFGNRKTTDNKSDNKVFILDAEQGTNVNYYTGSFQTIAPDKIRISGTLNTLPNGTVISISGAASNNGNFTVTNTSYLFLGFTTITVSGPAITSVALLSGIITYFDAAVYQPRRPAFVAVTGLLDPGSAFNIELSPKHLLLLHAPIISGGVYNSMANAALDTLKFQSGDKNVLLSVTYDNVNFVTENTDELLSQLPQPYYLPIVFTFETDYRPDVFTFLQGINKYKFIDFKWKGIDLSGYVIDVTNNPDNDEKQKWKLISIVSANILNLI